MGYFPNGASMEAYDKQLCSRCVHQKPNDGGCIVIAAHLLHNYAECNKPDSILHLLIPRDAEGRNQECRMFVETPPR